MNRNEVYWCVLGLDVYSYVIYLFYEIGGNKKGEVLL